MTLRAVGRALRARLLVAAEPELVSMYGDGLFVHAEDFRDVASGHAGAQHALDLLAPFFRLETSGVARHVARPVALSLDEPCSGDALLQALRDLVFS